MFHQRFMKIGGKREEKGKGNGPFRLSLSKEDGLPGTFSKSIAETVLGPAPRSVR